MPQNDPDVSPLFLELVDTLKYEEDFISFIERAPDFLKRAKDDQHGQFGMWTLFNSMIKAHKLSPDPKKLQTIQRFVQVIEDDYERNPKEYAIPISLLLLQYHPDTVKEED